MNRFHILLSTLILPIAFMARGQAPVDPKVQQLKDTWYQKAQELAELGAKIIEKNELLVHLQNDIRYLAQQAVGGFSEEDKNAFCKAFPLLIKDFYNKSFHAIRDDNNVKGFFMHELYTNKGELFKIFEKLSKDDWPGYFDGIKLDLVQIVIEADLADKLLEGYGARLQKMAEIEHELALLGEPRLYN